MTVSSSSSTSSISSLFHHTEPAAIANFSNNNYSYSPLGLIEEFYINDPWKLLISTIFLNRTRRIQVDRILYKFFNKFPTPQDVVACIGDDDDDEVCNHQNEETEVIISTMIRPLGIHHRRAKGIMQFTRDYMQLIGHKKKSDQQQHKQQQHLELQQQEQQPVRLDDVVNTAVKKKQQVQQKLPEPVEFTFTRKEIIENLFHCGTYAADAYSIFIKQDWDYSSNKQPTDHALQAYVEWKKGTAVLN